MKSKGTLGLVVAVAGLTALLLMLGSGGVGNATTPPDPVSCYCTQPDLSVSQSNAYWGMGDYPGTLSVDFNISNNSSNYANAHDLTIVGTTNSSGVLSVDHGRTINMVSAGECELVTVKYGIPGGVGSFNTHLSAETSDQCGNSYNYGAPMA